MRTLAAATVLLVAGAALAHPPPSVPGAASATAPPPRTLGGGLIRLDEVQGLLALARLDGWLLYDDHGLDPQAVELLRPSGPVAHRWFCLVPAAGEPVVLVARSDGDAFDAAPARKITYLSWRELEGALRGLLKGRKRIAMAYSPRAAVPSASRVDAGTIELVRATGVTVVPASGLAAHVFSRWSEIQRATHLYAARKLEALKDDLFTFIATRVAAGAHVNEYEVQQHALRSLAELGLESALPVVVAAGANTARPDYLATAHRSSELRPGDLVLLGLAARQANVPDAVYADLTFMGYLGDAVPARVAAAWSAVREARDRAVALLKERRAGRSAVAGYEVDDAVRAVIDKAGLGAARFGPSGRTLGVSPFPEGARLDDLETHDDRPLVPRSGLVVAPALYFPGEFGVKSGVDVYMGDTGIEVTIEHPQAVIELIGKAALAPAAPAPHPARSGAPAPPAPSAK